MLVVDLEEREESGWFDLGGGARVKLRLLSPVDVKEMQEACTKEVVEYPLLENENGRKEHRRFVNSSFNAELSFEMLCDKTIVEWEGILDRNGKPVPVTKENKLRLMTYVDDFIKVRDSGIEALKAAQKNRAEVSEKNL